MPKSKTYEISNDPIHQKRRRVAGSIAALVATGAFITAGGVSKAEGIISNANAPHGRAIPVHPVTIENAGGIQGGSMVDMQGNVKNESLPMTEITYHQDKDHSVYGFASGHLKGDPRQYLKELQSQLDKEDQATYNAPDGFVFKVPSDEVADMPNPEIGTAAVAELDDKDHATTTVEPQG